MAAATGISLFGDWKTAIKLMVTARQRFVPAASKALQLEAIRTQNIIRENIAAGPSPAQSPLTKATGGGGKALNRTGVMGQAVNIVKKGPLFVFIGIPRTDGKFNIAVVHENGAVIIQPLTDKMRAFLHVKLRKEGAPPIRGHAGGVLVIKIPARPFVGPAFDDVKSGFELRFGREFARALKGDYGKL